MRSATLALVGLVLLLLAAPAAAIGQDPAARGLDVFLHVPTHAAPGGTLSFTAEAFGFATPSNPLPLAGATLEAGWDPETLDGAVPPAPVRITADAAGRADLALPVPVGKPHTIDLLVSVRYGGHTRTRTVKVERAAAATVELHTADRRVVPSSTISAWVRVVGVTGAPLADTGVEIALLEGGATRQRQKLRTDRGGLVMARVPIPRIDEPVWEWTLRATADVPGSKPSEVTLTPREETPGKPTLQVAWDEPPAGARPGDKLRFTVRVRDASGQPLVGQRTSYWVGQKGVEPPQDDAWDKVATAAATDGDGQIERMYTAPTLVKSTGTSLIVHAHATVEGHALTQASSIDVGTSTPEATLMPEGGSVVPGLTQRSLLSVDDGHGAPIAGRFEVKGDGLLATVQTDARGEAELSWKAPVGIGADRQVGPCAGGVAAAVVVRPLEDLPALRGRRDPFSLCVKIDRDAHELVRVVPDVARPGEKVRITVEAAAPVAQGAARAGARTRAGQSVVLSARERAQAIAGWLAADAEGRLTGEVTIPDDAGAGLWSATVVTPDSATETPAASASFLVAPRVLPQLEARRISGRATPGGSIEVEARLTDGHGRGLPGSVSAIVVDAFGGGHANVSSLDTRARLCAELGAPSDACVAMLERDPKTDAQRRASLGSSPRTPTIASNDPAALARTGMRTVFGEVVRSLEGKVFEASASPSTLLDARRKENGRWVLNPELLTLVTEALPEPPLTPGGEPIVLSDLVAMDPQVTFDNVARRVTRLKLFRALFAVREERVRRSLDPEEPIFKDPNALLRRLVRAGTIQQDALLDPWGGTLQFVRSNAPQPPFLGTVRGWELRAPGPDGVLGNADDVRDPFERVLKSGTPYADAVQEDRIVDAKWDMVVSDDTVQAWKTMFEELTGTQLGLQGTGSGGGGRGEGIGTGSGYGYGAGRGGLGISTGDAFWSAPIRTDAEGRVRIKVPLGDAETTWTIALVGVPDGLGPASTTLAIPSDLPLSLRVIAGARWVDGDVVETHVVVRNRTKSALRATVHAAAESAAALDPRTPADSIVDVPAGGATTVRLSVRATRAGEGRLALTARAPGVPDDVLRHTWEIAPAGEKRVLTKTSWVDGERDLGLELDQGYRLDGAARVVLERGYDDAIAAALGAMEPEGQRSTLGLVDALDAATRIERWATTRDTPRHRALAGIARSDAERALARAKAYAKLDEAAWPANDVPHGQWPPHARLRALARPGDKGSGLCPLPLADEAALDAEPPPGPDQPPCWGAFVSSTSASLATEMDPARVAAAVVALADRPHRIAIASALADHLRTLVKLRADGEMDPPRGSLDDRAARATVYAALLRAARLGRSAASADVLFGRLAVLRDATGGYGSSSATLAVVRALLASQLDGHGTTRAHVRSGGVDRWVDVPQDGSVTIALPPGALDASVTTEGSGLVARLERPVLRMWTRPPPVQASPAGLEVVWPATAHAGKTDVLRVTLKEDADKPLDVDARIPLPPGVSLAEPVTGVAQLQGVLAIRQRVGSSPTVLEVPLRFALAGRVTAPEAIARLARNPSAPAVAPARSFVIR
jgi:hypothetical protein